MARHSGGAIVALLSDIAACWLVTAIPVVPIAAFTWSGLSSNPVSSRSTRGRGIIVGVGVGDWALPMELAHPTTDTQRLPRLVLNRPGFDAHLVSGDRCASRSGGEGSTRP